MFDVKISGGTMFLRHLIFCTIFSFAPLVLRGEMLINKWRTEGEIDIITRLGSKPTSERGQIAFSVPSLKLAGEYLLDRQNSVFFQVQMAKTRSRDSKKQQLDLTRAFYEWSAEDDSWIVRYGLIKSTYLDISEDLVDYDLISEYKTFANRYNYLPSADLGLEIHYVVNPYLDFSLGVFNGEENTQKEDGGQKDIYLTIAYDDPSFHLSALAIRGGYDEYEKPFNVKERNLARIAWKGSLFELGLEGLSAKELSNATVDYKRAETWDGGLYPEVVVQGQGASAWILMKVDAELEFLARKDFLDPYLEVAEDEIESENIAMILKYNFRYIILGYTKTYYRELHSSQSQEREFGFFGLRQIF